MMLNEKIKNKITEFRKPPDWQMKKIELAGQIASVIHINTEQNKIIIGLLREIVHELRVMNGEEIKSREAIK